MQAAGQMSSCPDKEAVGLLRSDRDEELKVFALRESLVQRTACAPRDLDRIQNGPYSTRLAQANQVRPQAIGQINHRVKPSTAS
jgi:hypothetical protein